MLQCGCQRTKTDTFFRNALKCLSFLGVFSKVMHKVCQWEKWHILPVLAAINAHLGRICRACLECIF